MKARVYHFAKPAKKNVDYVEEVKIDIDLPFVPAIGTALKITPNGEILIVNQVYWDAEDPAVIEVYTDEPADFGFLPLKDMLAEGWVIA